MAGAPVRSAHADSQEASCELRKDGGTQRGKSGPCTFGQRQGYIDNNGSDGNNGDYFINNLDKGGFEVLWKSPGCYISYDSSGYSTSTSQDCSNNQIQRSNEIARKRAR